MQYKKSNPTLLEWLSSPIVYLECGTAAEKLRKLLPTYFSPVHTLYHYLHIAKNKYDEVMSTDQVKIKRYFYILRPILACMWIEKNNTMPPMEFSKLMADQQLDVFLVSKIQKLLEKKTSGMEIDIEPKSSIIIDFLGDRIRYFEEYIKTAH